MAVTIHKKQTVDVQEQVKDTLVVVEQVDTYAQNLMDINEAVEAVKGLVADNKKAFPELQAHLDLTTPPDKGGALAGEKFILDFKPHGNQTTVTDAAKAFQLLEKVQKGLAKELMTFSITDLRKYLTPAQLEEVSIMEPKKARQVSAIEK